MSERGLLNRVRGGATLRGLNRLEPLFTDKQDQAQEAKRVIAESALALIEDGSSIYLDGGSTVLALASLLEEKKQLTVVTNSIMAAAALMDTRHKLLLIGGEFRTLSRTLVGPLSEPLLRQLHIDLAFMGTIGFSLTDGMMTTDPNEAFTKEMAMSRAACVVLMMDSSKFSATAFASCGSVEDIDVLITDAIDDELNAHLTERGVLVRHAT